MPASAAPRLATAPAEQSSSYVQAAVAPPPALPVLNTDPPPSAVRPLIAPALPIIATTQQTQNCGTAHTTSTSVDANTATAVAIPVSHYERKARQTHQAMLDIHHSGYGFAETAEWYELSIEELGRDFATFGSQAVEVAKQRNVYVDTMYRAMGLNKSGHSTDIEHALPKAMRQKRAEGEGRSFNTGRGRQDGPSHRRPGTGARDVKAREEVAMPTLPGSKV